MCGPRARGGLAVAGVLLASATVAAQDATVTVTKRAVLLATIEATCSECAWDVPGREAVMLIVNLDGRYSQHLPLVRPGKSDYHVLLGTVLPGSHTARLRVDRQQTAAALNEQSATAKIVQLDAVNEGEAGYQPLALAPFVYQRPNTIGRFSDMPVFMWYEVEPTTQGTRYRYSVIFTNEDGGTPADRLMATWGRTTDIEYVYSVEIDTRGRILAHDYQGPKHEVLPYRGQLEARHARLWVATDNNMVVDRGSVAIRFAPKPIEFVLKNMSREEVMDANPWLYALSARELAREGKIVADAPPGKGVIPDIRRFVYFEGCGDLGNLALTFGLRLASEDAAAGAPPWISSDRGIPEYRIVRDGCFRAAIPLPGRRDAREVRAVRVQVHARDAAAPTSAVRFTRLNTVFTLDDAYVPGPRMLHWEGSVELRPDGAPFEIAIP